MSVIHICLHPRFLFALIITSLRCKTCVQSKWQGLHILYYGGRHKDFEDPMLSSWDIMNRNIWNVRFVLQHPLPYFWTIRFVALLTKSITSFELFHLECLRLWLDKKVFECSEMKKFWIKKNVANAKTKLLFLPASV